MLPQMILLPRDCGSGAQAQWMQVWTEDQIAIISFISHSWCLLRAVLPHRHKWLLLWPSPWKEFPNPVPVGIRLASLAYPCTHAHWEILLGHGKLQFLSSHQKPRLWPFSLTSFYSSDTIEKFLLSQRNLGGLTASWARPVHHFGFGYRKMSKSCKSWNSVLLQWEFKTQLLKSLPTL